MRFTLQFPSLQYSAYQYGHSVFGRRPHCLRQSHLSSNRISFSFYITSKRTRLRAATVNQRRCDLWVQTISLKFP